MGDLTKIGMILALIGGIVAVVNGILAIIGETINELTLGTYSIGVGGDIIDAIIVIIAGIILIYLYLGKVNVKDGLVLGILVIVLGILGGGILAILGGVLIIVDELM